MAYKVDIPKNSLGSYLTSKGISSIDIHAKTGIPAVELSQLRNGLIKGISGKKLFLIVKAADLYMDEALKQVYPDLKLVIQDQKSLETSIDTMKDFFDSIEENTLQIVANKTKIPITRLKNIKANKVNLLAHELYLIELATKTNPGTLFHMLYQDLKLTTPEEEAWLRKEEKIRGSKK
ncbi:hypothetical protein [Pedobacter sp. B4-66]|uniref:hypothetical protein n=1 Tax=Pedobacter sp. B4-66 TaxID=2817280 RepID=UPI001BDA9143|nr:hypothetical protein [Pedobacter sp. B4-66]